MATGSDYSHDRAVRGQNCARSELCGGAVRGLSTLFYYSYVF